MPVNIEVKSRERREKGCIIGYFIFHKISQLRESFSRRTRARRLQQFQEIMGVKGGERIIDLGGVPQFWDEIHEPLDITVINLPGSNPPYDGSSHHKITLLEGDAYATNFANQSLTSLFQIRSLSMWVDT
jgi:hypothetical protein